MTITDILVIVLVVFLLLLVIFFAVLIWAADMDRALQDKEWEHYGDFETNGWDSTDDAEQLAYIRKYNAKREANKYNQKCDSIANREASQLDSEKDLRIKIFTELLADMTIPAKDIAQKHKCPLGVVEKYYEQFFEKYNGGAANE